MRAAVTLREHVGRDLDQVRLQLALVPLAKHRGKLRRRHAEGLPQEVVRLGEELDVGVLDPVVHHLHEVARSVRADVSAAGDPIDNRRDRRQHLGDTFIGRAGASRHDARPSKGPLLPTRYARSDENKACVHGGPPPPHRTRRRRAEAAEKAGLGFIGAGVSGGEEGALRGPSIMPGGTRASYERVAEMLTSISAKVDGTPCCTYIGPDGAGHFVKMVHNGIEYADIQLIAETYDFLREALGVTPAELAAVFREWNQGELQSYLIEITANVLAKDDGASGSALVDAIVDQAEQKGTGRWTSESTLELGVQLTGSTEAVCPRMLSSQKAQRDKAADILAGPTGRGSARPNPGLVDDE